MDKLFNRFQKLNDEPLEETVFSKIWLVYDTHAKTQSFSKDDIAESAPSQPTEQVEPTGETEDASVEDMKDQETEEVTEDTNQS